MAGIAWHLAGNLYSVISNSSCTWIESKDEEQAHTYT